jgi:hypothetical protein
MMKVIKLIGVFIWWCLRSPMDIREHWDDIRTRYFFETDEEMQEIIKEINQNKND